MTRGAGWATAASRRTWRQRKARVSVAPGHTTATTTSAMVRIIAIGLAVGWRMAAPPAHVNNALCSNLGHYSRWGRAGVAPARGIRIGEAPASELTATSSAAVIALGAAALLLAERINHVLLVSVLCATITGGSLRNSVRLWARDMRLEDSYLLGLQLGFLGLEHLLGNTHRALLSTYHQAP